jgi:hypothetical protein
MSADRESWQEVDHKEDNEDVNTGCATGMCAAADKWEVSRNYGDDDTNHSSEWRILGKLIAQTADSSDVPFRRRGWVEAACSQNVLSVNQKAIAHRSKLAEEFGPYTTSSLSWTCHFHLFYVVFSGLPSCVHI